MGQPLTYTVTGSARIDAAPQRIYDVIRDYRVESGGIGAGTTIRFDVTVLGQTQHYKAVVSEPDPGRVLVERNVEPNDSVTTFFVAPENGGRAATVRIETEMKQRPGIAGKIERFLIERVLPPMYDQELKNL